ncbi:MAG: 3-hydroxyacyl-CoA dehydrogenase NAD-binding domain-containing protein [Planctomycetota bacterium]
MDIDKIAVIGMSSLGRGIVERLSTAAMTVKGYDPSAKTLAGAKTWLQDIRALFVSTGLIDPETRQTAIRMTTLGLDIDDAVRSADLIIDATDALEPDARQTLWKKIAIAAPENAIIAVDLEMNGFDQLPEPFASRSHPIIGLRWYQPVSTMKLVEVSAPDGTSPDIVDVVTSILTAADIQTTTPQTGGFNAVSRMRMALLREAFAMIESGEATPEVIATAVQKVIGPQLTAAGLFGYLSSVGLGRVTFWLTHDLPLLSTSLVPPKRLADAIAANDSSLIDDLVAKSPDGGDSVHPVERKLARILMVAGE